VCDSLSRPRQSSAFAGRSVRPGRLELPPRLRRTRPSTLGQGCACSRSRTLRVFCPPAWTSWKHRTGCPLSACCHGTRSVGGVKRPWRRRGGVDRARCGWCWRWRRRARARDSGSDPRALATAGLRACAACRADSRRCVSQCPPVPPRPPRVPRPWPSRRARLRPRPDRALARAAGRSCPEGSQWRPVHERQTRSCTSRSADATRAQGGLGSSAVSLRRGGYARGVRSSG
jgi:hypothetical protein